MEKFVRLLSGCHGNIVCCVLCITLWLQYALVSQHFIAATVNAATQQPDDLEGMNLGLHSTARFQQSLFQQDSIDRELLQVVVYKSRVLEKMSLVTPENLFSEPFKN